MDTNLTLSDEPKRQSGSGSMAARSVSSSSARMSKVRSRDTKPELAVRSAAHALGYRFRLYRRDLPGCPDLLFPRNRVALFVHGCFWHRHAQCRRASTPATDREFWIAKFERNVRRDAQVADALRAEGWDVRIIWECETRNTADLRDKLLSILT
jgi:DNA mismatch endonuclease (patch repair protein)